MPKCKNVQPKPGLYEIFIYKLSHVARLVNSHHAAAKSNVATNTKMTVKESTPNAVGDDARLVYSGAVWKRLVQKALPKTEEEPLSSPGSHRCASRRSVNASPPTSMVDATS